MKILTYIIENIDLNKLTLWRLSLISKYYKNAIHLSEASKIIYIIESQVSYIQDIIQEAQITFSLDCEMEFHGKKKYRLNIYNQDQELSMVGEVYNGLPRGRWYNPDCDIHRGRTFNIYINFDKNGKLTGEYSLALCSLPITIESSTISFMKEFLDPFLGEYIYFQIKYQGSYIFDDQCTYPKTGGIIRSVLDEDGYRLIYLIGDVQAVLSDPIYDIDEIEEFFQYAEQFRNVFDDFLHAVSLYKN